MHSVALLAVETAFPGNQKVWPKSLLAAGMTMFSGSIYLLVLDPQRFKVMGPITPLGGVALIGGGWRWLLRRGEERCVEVDYVLSGGEGHCGRCLARAGDHIRFV